MTYVGDRSLPELVEDVRVLPPRTVVLYLMLQRDRAGGVHLPHEALARISRASSAPVYALFETYLGSGTVGGRVISFREMGTDAGELGREILLGRARRPRCRRRARRTACSCSTGASCAAGASTRRRCRPARACCSAG